MEIRLFSKYAITAITVGILEPTNYEVNEYDRTVHKGYFQLGYLDDFLKIKNDDIGASVYVYRPKINKNIISLPHVFIEFSNCEIVKHVFNTDDELDEYMTDNGLKKLMGSNHFFNPYNRTL